jgi:hypothetical protein
MAKAPINIKIEGDYSDRDIKRAQRDLESLKRNSQQTTQKFGAMSRGMKLAGVAIAAAAAGAAVGVTRFAAQSVGAASDLDESLSKTRTVFGDASDAVEKFAQDAATNLGLSEQAALEATSTFGNLFTAMGINTGKASSLSQEIVQLAADLASFNNIEVEEAIIALRSGLVGETEPLRRLGVNLSAARINAEALSSGLVETKGQIDAAAKAQAAFNLIMDDTATAQGDFARTSDGLANTTRTLQAAVQDAQATIGRSFVEAILRATDAMGGPGGLEATISQSAEDVDSLLVGLSQFTRNVQNFIGGVTGAADATETFADEQTSLARGLLQGIPLIGVYLSGFLQYGEGVKEGELETEQFTATLRAMNDAMSGNISVADHLVGEIADLSSMTQRAAAAARQFAAETGTQLFQVQAANKYYRDAGVRLKRLADDEEAAAEAADNLGRSAGSAGSAVNSLADRIEDARGRAIEGIKRMRQGLKDELDATRQEFDDFSVNVSNAITGAIDFAAADSMTKVGANGEEVGMTFLEGLQAQAEKAREFATKIQELITAGLSQEAITQVLAAGVDAGTNIANELIEGGATAIDDTNRLVQSTQEAADKVGLDAAQHFLGAGVTSAHATVVGFDEFMKPGAEGFKKLMHRMDKLAKKAARQVIIDVKVTKHITEEIEEIKQSVRKRALGGPVDAGSPFLVGERGPELFVPNISGMIVPNNELRPSGGNVINLTVNAGMGTDSRQVSKQIVDALKHYQRSNGPLPLKVAG